jgi:hypothetical protein
MTSRPGRDTTGEVRCASPRLALLAVSLLVVADVALSAQAATDRRTVLAGGACGAVVVLLAYTRLLRRPSPGRTGVAVGGPADGYLFALPPRGALPAVAHVADNASATSGSYQRGMTPPPQHGPVPYQWTQR